MELTREEREKFATWALERAKSNRGLAEQMEKLGAPSAPIKAITEQYKNEAVALSAVARLLLSIHDDSV